VSARPLVFEGPDPEQLLLDAWARFGTNVRISEPVCVRTGGVGGFFAKLSYRIEVEPVAAEEESLAAHGAFPAPDYLSSGLPPMPARRDAPWGRHRAEAGAAPANPANGEAARADALDRLIADTEDVFERTEMPRRTFDEVLQDVASSLGDEVGTSEIGAVAAMRPVVMSDATNAAAQYASNERENSAPPSITYERPTPPVHSDTAADFAPIEVPAIVRDATTPPVPEESMATEPPPQPNPTMANAATTETRPPIDHGETALVRRELAGIGFPLTLLARLPDDVEDELSAAFDLLPVPRPLPVVPGALIAVVGELGDAFVAAGDIAEALELEEIELCVASPEPPAFDLDSHLVVHEAKRAAALAPGWRRDTIAIVVVDSGHPLSTPGWLRSMLRGLRPTATWALASAAEKAEDVAFFAESIGGVDALLLSGLASTVTPASIVATGIPVARLDGAIASTTNWIEAVADRLDAAVHRAAS
jgi:hypothetical protein